VTKLKVSEIFYSLQGEGLYLGTPSVFLRLFGCNFTCSGFGMPKGETSQERFGVDPSKYSSYNELPLVHTGCDSYASWDPRFKHLSPVLSIEEIVDKIQALLPDGKFGINKHFIITGGEPLLLGWQKKIPEIINEIYKRNMDLGYLTIETNGTQKLTNDLKQFLIDLSGILEVTFSISSKLPISGETWGKAIRPDVIKSYDLESWSASKHNIFFKWVVQNEQDVEDVKRAIKEYNMPEIPVYLMPVGGTTKLYNLTHKEVAEIAMKNGWRYSPRIQVELWANQWGT
jgi:organic radical activating enzyme